MHRFDAFTYEFEIYALFAMVVSHIHKRIPGNSNPNEQTLSQATTAERKKIEEIWLFCMVANNRTRFHVDGVAAKRCRLYFQFFFHIFSSKSVEHQRRFGNYLLHEGKLHNCTSVAALQLIERVCVLYFSFIFGFAVLP